MEKKGRRSFLVFSINWAIAFIGGVLSLAAGIPLIGFAISPAFKKGESNGSIWVSLTGLKTAVLKRWTIPSQQRTAGSKQRKKRSVYVTDAGNGEWRVFSRICSHLGCLVRWDESKESFLCPCHGAIFDKTGAVVAGPPPEPLQKLETKVEAGILYVKEM